MHKSLWRNGITILMLSLTACTNAMSKNVTKYEWYATESAPKHYPMEIIQGTFFYHGEPENGMYIPSGGVYTKGWGESISTHSSGDDLKPLPDRLSIVFFSFVEKQFYKGEFELPYEKILTLFREGIAADKKRPYYSEVIVGTAPGGAVAVWLGGFRIKEVFFGQAEKLDRQYGRVRGLPFDNQQAEDAYLAKQLVNVLKPEELESLKKDGIPFGLWSRYRNLYRWAPTLVKGVILSKYDIFTRYLNGEMNVLSLPLTQELANTPRSLPRKFSYFPIIDGKSQNYIIYFDEFELMEVFEKLGTNGQLVNIEFDPRVPREETRLRVYNDKESIELKKTRVAAK